MTITMRDVARKAGVSLITVSRVINGSVKVGSETRSRVEAAIEELQYVPNQMASNLRSKQSDTIALLLPDITNSFWTSMARGVEDEAWARGYGMFLCNTDDKPDKEARYIDILLRRRVEGVLIVPTIEAAPQLERMQRRRMKLVVLHRDAGGIDADTICGDSQGGTRALTEHLLDAGWRRIGYVGGPLTMTLERDRLAGYSETIRSAGLATDPALIKLGSYSQRTGYRLTMELTQAVPRPEAIVIGNSRLALGALRALADAGLQVPEDIAVAAFHDINELDDYAPRLITAVQPSYDIGRLGVCRLLDARLPDDTEPVKIVLPNRIKGSDIAARGRLATV